ncbi:DUF2071 domain-containing protein [Flammeovirga sp. SJP92]|uniref:DUF2071 domain-containing protein n=1 Tax=Flammeovirga sp. SJP92 TaxID=1775430 RepID=UPI0007897FD3|nr:DUF2071 domain-containing protein [Flammeovirga sp. SJP92]KXX68728.1 hypothetical protein AVL50_18825 [Flammeovirga sp. SJP92]
MNFESILKERINQKPLKQRFNVHTFLEHFSIVSYKVELHKIAPLIPEPFKLWTFESGDREYALISAVTFKDKDFQFHNINPKPKFAFYQTNFRSYIINKKTNEHCAWFFGTNLGSVSHIIPKYLWKMPWEQAKYQCAFHVEANVYQEYSVLFESKTGKGIVEIEGSTLEMQLLEGFKSIEEQFFILTHPVEGFYHTRDHQLGTYEIWHPKMKLQMGTAKKLYFEFLERLGLVSEHEMNEPHSVLITPSIEFEVILPPKKVK